MNKPRFQSDAHQMAQLYVNVTLRCSLDKRKTLHLSGTETVCVDLGILTVDVHAGNRMLALMAASRCMDLLVQTNQHFSVEHLP